MKTETREEIGRQATERVVELLGRNDQNVTRVASVLGVNKGLVSRVAHGGFSETVNVSLGLPVVHRVEMPICLECGEVHEIKRTCDTARSRAPYRRRKSADLNAARWGAIQNASLDRLAKNAGFNSWTEFVVNLANEYVNVLGSEWLGDRLDEILDADGIPDDGTFSITLNTEGVADSAARELLVNALATATKRSAYKVLEIQ